jgi:hypothetical protein
MALLCIVIEILVSCMWHSHENFAGNLTQIIPHIKNLCRIATHLSIEDRLKAMPIPMLMLVLVPMVMAMAMLMLILMPIAGGDGDADADADGNVNGKARRR